MATTWLRPAFIAGGAAALAGAGFVACTAAGLGGDLVACGCVGLGAVGAAAGASLAPSR